MDCSPPGSSVHGILQARILERVAMPSSRGSSRPRYQTQVSCIQVDSLPSEPLGKLYMPYIQAHTHTYMCAHTHMHVHACMYRHMCTHEYTPVYTCAWTHNIFTNTTYACTCVHGCTYICMNLYTYTCAHMNMSLSKLQETVKDRGAWHDTVHRVTKSQTWLSNWTMMCTHTHSCTLTYMHIQMHIYTRVCENTYIYAWAQQTDAHIFTHTCTYAHTYTCEHTHIYAWTQ